MPKMSTIVEAVSVTAVILSLVFVGFEIRNSAIQVEQNTKALRIDAYQDLIARIVELNRIDIELSTNLNVLATLDHPTPEEAQASTAPAK